MSLSVGIDFIASILASVFKELKDMEVRLSVTLVKFKETEQHFSDYPTIHLFQYRGRGLWEQQRLLQFHQTSGPEIQNSNNAEEFWSDSFIKWLSGFLNM